MAGRFARPFSFGLLKRDLGEAAQLARMQALRFLQLETFERPDPDLEVLADALAVELAGHAGELDLAMQRLVGNAKQRAVGNPKREAVGGDRRRLHIERDRARLRQAADDRAIADLPVAVVDA